MGVYSGPEVSESGLVLALDAGNTKGFDSNENLLLQSEDFANASWTKQNGFSITSNTAIAPDGTLTADTASRVNLSTEYLFQGYGGTPGTFTLSCWVRTVSGTATFQMFTYNGTDGTLGVVTHTATTTWQRFSTTATVTTTSNWYPCIPTTSNTEFYIWGAQLERGTTVSNYYKTIISIKNRGTTWIDLSGLNNTGTLTNGPTYSSANGGSLVFDGTNACVSSFPIQISGTGSKTISCFFKVNTTARTGLCGTRSNVENNGWVFTVNRNIPGNLTYFHTGGSTLEIAAGININTWYNGCVTYDTTTATAILYLNGVQIGSPLTSFSVITTSGFNGVVGAEQQVNTQTFNGNISQVSIYNRALTAAEVQQNFNATRSRYGI